ncbi:MAG: hypothetical protein JSR34_02605 [Proteobacteria bacterium]|nr:hypothetical protein [Pseudomonadota bacterium]
MREFTVLAIGAACGLLGAAGIFFDARVPGKKFIVAAGGIRGALVALLTALTVGIGGTWLGFLGYGCLFGFVTGLMVVLSKGEGAAQHAVFILPVAAISGTLSGVLIKVFVT